MLLHRDLPGPMESQQRATSLGIRSRAFGKPKFQHTGRRGRISQVNPLPRIVNSFDLGIKPVLGIVTATSGRFTIGGKTSSQLSMLTDLVFAQLALPGTDWSPAMKLSESEYIFPDAWSKLLFLEAAVKTPK